VLASRLQVPARPHVRIIVAGPPISSPTAILYVLVVSTTVAILLIIAAVPSMPHVFFSFRSTSARARPVCVVVRGAWCGGCVAVVASLSLYSILAGAYTSR